MSCEQSPVFVSSLNLIAISTTSHVSRLREDLKFSSRKTKCDVMLQTFVHRFNFTFGYDVEIGYRLLFHAMS